MKKTMVILFVVLIGFWGVASAQSFDLLDGLVAYYSLSETTGIRYDSQGDYDLTAVNNPGSDGSGVSGRALDCNRTSNDYLAINDNTAWSLQNDFTLSFWLNYRSTASTSTILQKRISILGAWNEYQIYHNAGTIPQKGQLIYEQIGGGASTTIDFPFPSSPIAAKWYHILIEQDSVAGTINIEIDGIYTKLTSVGSNLIGNSVGAVTVCGRYTHSGEFLDGMIDEIGIWHRLLTVQEKNFIRSGVGYDEIVEASLPAATPAVPVLVDEMLPNGERVVLENTVTTGEAMTVIVLLVVVAVLIWERMINIMYLLINRKQ